MNTWHIVGSDGYIASRLLPRIPFEIKYYGYTMAGTEETAPLELTDLKSANFEKIQKGDYVIFLAAVSSPDVCRDQYEMAYAINVTGTKKFIETCTARGANVLFFSTDVVIGATTQAAYETSIPHPFGNYGRMKREIEEYFAGNNLVKVFRLSYVMSNRDKFISYLNGCADSGSVADVFSALYRSVVYIEDVISAVIALGKSFDQWENQIFHICGEELIGRSDLAAMFKEKIKPNLQYTVSMPDTKFFEARPNIIETKSMFLEKLLNRKPTKVADAIEEEFKNI